MPNNEHDTEGTRTATQWRRAFDIDDMAWVPRGALTDIADTIQDMPTPTLTIPTARELTGQGVRDFMNVDNSHISSIREYTLYLTIDNRVLFFGQLNGCALHLYELWPRLRHYEGEISLATPIYAAETLKLGGVGLMMDLIGLFSKCSTVEEVSAEFRSILNYEVQRSDGTTYHPNQRMEGFKRPYTIMNVLGVAKARVEPSLPEETMPTVLNTALFENRAETAIPCHLMSVSDRLMIVCHKTEDKHLFGNQLDGGTFIFTASARISRGISHVQDMPKHEDFDKLLYTRDAIFVEEFWMATGPHTPQKVYDDIASVAYTDPLNGYKLIWRENEGYLIQRIGINEDGDELWEEMPLP